MCKLSVILYECNFKVLAVLRVQHSVVALMGKISSSLENSHNIVAVIGCRCYPIAADLMCVCRQVDTLGL